MNEKLKRRFALALFGAFLISCSCENVGHVDSSSQESKARPFRDKDGIQSGDNPFVGTPEWDLPIGLGDARERVRSILGDNSSCMPPFPPSETCDRFPNSGMSVEYDGGRVHAITIGGGKADTDHIPYESSIVHGVSIRDEMRALEQKLGVPTVVEPGPPPRYKWRRPPFMIEVVIGTGRDADNPKGKILWITITNAMG